MADKETRLSIIIRAVDKATGPFRALVARVRENTGPMRDLGSKLSGLASSGVGKLVGIFKSIGSAVGDVLKSIPVLGAAIAGVVGGAVFGLKSLTDHYDELGDKAAAIGVGVDFLAQTRYAAERSGVEVEKLDEGLKGFVSSLGQAKAGTGRMAAFLGKISPQLLKQVKATKSSEAAFDLLANAMVKLTDPAKRAAFAQKTLGDASLAPLLSRGARGIQELRDRYFQLAGSQKDAADKGGEVDDAMHDLNASVDGVKAALVVGLAPAMKVVVDRLRDWFAGHRDDIKQWALDLGEKLPGAIQKTVEKLEAAVEKIKALFEIASRLRRKVFGPDVDEQTDEMYAKAAAFQRNSKLTPQAARMLAKTREQEALALYTKPEGMSEEDQINYNVDMRLAADARKAGDPFGDGSGMSGPGFDPEAFKHRYAEADPSKFEKYDTQFLPGLDTIRDLAASLAPAARPDIAGHARGAARGRGATDKAKITIDINGAPRGTRVKTDPQSTADVDLNTGYQTAGAL